MLICCMESYYYTTFKNFLFGGNLEGGVEAGVASNSAGRRTSARRRSRGLYYGIERCRWTHQSRLMHEHVRHEEMRGLCGY